MPKSSRRVWGTGVHPLGQGRTCGAMSAHVQREPSVRWMTIERPTTWYVHN